MKLNTIKIENFLSIEEAEVNFEDFSELVRVVGVNNDTNPKSSNGAGKSSIIEAIAFALFGKTIRKTNEKSLGNLHTKGKCRVTIRVNDNVVVERTKKPPMLKVMVDGKNCTKEGVNHTQKYLESILNTNSSVFLASIVFGQGNSTNFLTASAEEKRNIIQNFLSVSELFKQRQYIKAIKSKNNNDKKVYSTLVDDANSKLAAVRNRKRDLTKLCKEADKSLTPEKLAFVRSHTISEIQELERTNHELEVEYNRLLSQKSEARGIAERALLRIQKYENGKCEHCDKVSLYIWEMLQADRKIAKEAGEAMERLQLPISRVKKELSTAHLPIQLQDFDLIEKVKSFEAEIKILKGQIKVQKKVCTKHIKDMSAAQKQYDLMRFWETAFSEQGLVKYVIRNILSFFNERSNYYLGFLTQGNFSIEFDELLQETILNKKKPAYFNTLSGGEKKKLSLSVMLALNDLLLLTGKDRSNVIFFDEIADSLDEEGIKGLYELIQEITQSKRLFVITHNDNLTSLIEDWSDVLEVTKKKHISKVRKL
tara:strand:- start:357 stop:1970 length:1614 start_codon:yes stop_codon:yes gene_type:complete